MTHYFISDLHLDPSRSHCIEGFLRYLSQIKASDQLYILGDLFEAWLGDDDDTAYMKIRPMLRDPSFQKQLIAKPILERQAIALDARAESQAHTSQTKLAIMDVNPQAVRDALLAQQCQTIIHGHTHRPFDHHSVLEDQIGRRMVLGDWDIEGWHIREKQGALILEAFAL